MSTADELPDPADIQFVSDVTSRVPTDLNPYQSSAEAAPTLAAELVAEPVATVRPHPGLGMAIVWTLAVATAQIVISVVVIVPYMAFLAANGTPLQEMEGPINGLSGVMLFVATITTLAVAFAIVRPMLGRDYLRLVGWRGFSLLQLVWVVLLVLPLQLVAGEVSAWAAEVLPSFNGEMLEGMSELPFVLLVLGGCVLPAVGEELLFRGFFSRGLMGNYGLWIGALLASMLFALLHLDPVQVCGTFILGLGFQYIFVASRSLLLAMVSHFLNNLLAFVMMRLTMLEAAAERDASEHVPLSVVLAALIALLPLLGLLYQSRTFWRLPEGSRWSPPHVSCEGPPQSIGAQAETGRPSLLLVLALFITYALFVAALVSSGTLTN